MKLRLAVELAALFLVASCLAVDGLIYSASLTAGSVAIALRLPEADVPTEALPLACHALVHVSFGNVHDRTDAVEMAYVLNGYQ